MFIRPSKQIILTDNVLLFRNHNIFTFQAPKYFYAGVFPNQAQIKIITFYKIYMGGLNK